jgi:hypothetical protein
MFTLHFLKIKGFFTPLQLQKYEEFFEQGLCPGMMAEKSCPPGKMVRQEQSSPACEKICGPKK